MVVDYSVDYIQFPEYELFIPMSILKEAMYMCYNNFAFSTHGYVNNGTSIDSLKYHKAGNCVAFSMIIKKYLKNNYKINSHLITASVPNKWRTKGLNDICHCALCVPIDKDKCYIIDCAFYMNEPILMNLSISSKQKGNLTCIRKFKKIPYTYTTILNCNNSENVLPETPACMCTFDQDQDTWYYYLNEIFNPDECFSIPYFNAISPNHIFIKTKVLNGDIVLSNTTK
jgi:hypothetical protein